MNLIKFLISGAILSTVFGEFGHFPFGSSQGAVYLADVLLALAGLFFLIWQIVNKKRILFPKVFIWVIMFWITGFISLIWSLGFFPADEIVKGSLYLLRFILYSLTLLIVYNLQQEKITNFQKIASLLIMVGVIIVILGFFQLWLFPNFNNPFMSLAAFGFDPHQGRLASTFLDPNFFGAYLVLILGLEIFYLFNQPVKTKWIFLAALTALAIILTYSRSAYLMLAVSFLSLTILTGKRFSNQTKIFVLAGLVIFGIILSIFLPKIYQRTWEGLTIDRSAAERISSWQEGGKIFKKAPIFGIGFNNLRLAKQNFNLIKVYSPEGGHSGAGIDSSFLTVLATTGLFGFCVYLFFWLATLKKLFKSKTLSSLIVFSLLLGLLINSQFINSLFFPPLMLGYFSILGTVLKN